MRNHHPDAVDGHADLHSEPDLDAADTFAAISDSPSPPANPRPCICADRNPAHHVW
jgi:hypothetical protein